MEQRFRRLGFCNIRPDTLRFNGIQRCQHSNHSDVCIYDITWNKRTQIVSKARSTTLGYCCRPNIISPVLKKWREGRRNCHKNVIYRSIDLLCSYRRWRKSPGVSSSWQCLTARNLTLLQASIKEHSPITCLPEPSENCAVLLIHTM